jgi:hypothetical protein
MWEVIHVCVIKHNMVIESDRKTRARHFGPYECAGLLADVDHQVLVDFANFISMNAEIRDSDTH